MMTPGTPLDFDGIVKDLKGQLADGTGMGIAMYRKQTRVLLDGIKALQTRLPEAVTKEGKTPRTDEIARHYGFGAQHPMVEWSAQLEIELAEAKFRPIGDNHHNAVLCPYCNPLVNGSAAVSPLGRKSD